MPKTPKYVEVILSHIQTINDRLNDLHADIKDIKLIVSQNTKDIAQIQATGRTLKWIAGVISAIVAGIIAGVTRIFQK